MRAGRSDGTMQMQLVHHLWGLLRPDAVVSARRERIGELDHDLRFEQDEVRKRM